MWYDMYRPCVTIEERKNADGVIEQNKVVLQQGSFFLYQEAGVNGLCAGFVANGSGKQDKLVLTCIFTL